MTTTTLYAEILVVGSGTALFIVLLFYSLFGNVSWASKLGGLSSIESVVSLIPVLSLFYLLGIVVINVAHILFEGREQERRRKGLSRTESDYETIRNTLYTSSHKELIDDFEFRRSKVRICRGWFINAALIIIALLTYLWTGQMPATMVWFWIITVGLLMIGTRVSWWTATDTELQWLKAYAKQNSHSPNPTE
jgi:hypothetical protein